jgi:hypothetical protein
VTRPITERGSPANLDAEEGLLASCIIDPAVIVRAEEHGITAASFFAPKNGLIWEATKAVNAKGEPVDEISVCEELNRRNQLDAVGGHAGINYLTNRVETTAHSLYWVKLVKQKAIARRLITAAATLSERAHAGEDLEALLTRGESAIAELMAETAKGEDVEAEKKESASSARRAAKLLKKAYQHAFDPQDVPPDDPPILTLAGTPIWHINNILAFIAPQKCGKTSSLSAIVSSMMGPPGRDYLGFQGFNPRGLQVRYYDCEQSKKDFYWMQMRALRRAGVHCPPWFQALHLKRYSPKERREIVLADIRAAHASGGIVMALVDGAAGLVQDFNDLGESSAFVAEFLSLTETCNCGVAFSLHVNPGKGSEKARGHLGTILEQLAETIIISSKEPSKVINCDVITIRTKDARHETGGSVSFAWNDEHKMHRTLPLGEGFEAVSSLDKAQAKAKPDLAVLARDVFDGFAGMMPYVMLEERVMRAANVKSRSAQYRINDMMRAGHITKTTSGHYGLNVQGDN